jgi:lipopolysaccharide biosynthesis regulator YciM
LGYVKTLEKVFAEAKIRNWNAEQSKKELIKAEVERLSQVSSVDVEIFKDLYDSFQKAYNSIGRIVEIKEDLSQKYQDCLDCLEFINYVAYLYINFDELQKGEISAEDLKVKLISARMNVLSSDGTPSLIVLEDIYEEFKQMLLSEK